MERIKSFTINHNILKPGFYISRKDGEIVTYDLRTRKPNAGDYMSNSAMHSVEHMFATCVRNICQSLPCILEPLYPQTADCLLL